MQRNYEEFRTAVAALQVEVDDLRQKRVEEKARAIDLEMRCRETLERAELEWRG